MTKRFEDLSHFIRNQMRMSHIYQPVMLIELLSNKGQSTVRNIAKAILSKDESQIEYYEHITKNMVGRVLTKNRGITEKDKKGNYDSFWKKCSQNFLITGEQSKVDEKILSNKYSILESGNLIKVKILGS